MLSRYSLPMYAQYTGETNTLRSAKAFAVFWSLYCSKQHSTSANDVVVPAAKMPSATRAGDRANYENGMSVRWKKKSTGLLGKERAEDLKNSPCRASVRNTMRNARFPPTSRYREFSQCGGECVHSALEESSTVTLDTWNILSRTVDHAYRLFTSAITIVQLIAGSRYVVSLSRVCRR